MPDVYAIVRQAIIEKKQIIAIYQGLPREMCPHVIGMTNGRPQALFFQFAGESSRGLPDEGEWRCIPIYGLSDVSMRDARWYTGTGHSQDQTCVDEVDVEVAY